MARILVVDDSAIMRKNLQTLLAQAGHELVGEAGNGMEALELFEKTRPDLVTMDIAMPGMDGVTAVKLIMERFPDARIIMISAENQKSLVYDALKSGARHYLTKPLRLNKLAEVLDGVLGASGAAPVSARPAPLATVRHPAFQLRDEGGRLLLELGGEFSAADCAALRDVLVPLTSLAPLKLELSVADGMLWNKTLAKTLFGLLGEWQLSHGPARWL
ncbi:MAG: response regulator [Gammaproteobacteria bacterium]|nr:response regulator [Gammaproteobacteria bacterium]